MNELIKEIAEKILKWSGWKTVTTGGEKKWLCPYHINASIDDVMLNNLDILVEITQRKVTGKLNINIYQTTASKLWHVVFYNKKVGVASSSLDLVEALQSALYELAGKEK